jgi:hypothetical protein
VINAVTVGGKTIKLDDLPLDVFFPIEKETGVSWLEVISQPMRHARAGFMLIAEAARVLGVEPPESLTAVEFIESFTLADDDRPEAFKDGLPLPEEPSTS